VNLSHLTGAAMIFFQEFYLGFKHLTPGANAGVYAHVPNLLRVERVQVDAASGYAGSCHVLEMGRHYSEYVRYRGRFPAFNRVAGFPTGDYLRQLDTKSRASNITGNIGEIVAGLVARRTLKIHAGGIAPLQAGTSTQTPDYLLKPTAAFEQRLKVIVPLLAAAALPDWWPMEAKARGDGKWKGCVEGAVGQLAAYWYYNRTREPQRVGYGIVVATELKQHRRVRVLLFAPSNQSALIAHMNGFLNYKKYRDDFRDNPLSTGTHLMNYA
jgi:hypothetical protein